MSHTIFHTHLCHAPSFTHHLSHTTLSPTPSFTHHLSPHHLSHTSLSHIILVTHHLCHTPSFTHIFVTHHLSHTSLSHTTLSPHHLSHTTLSHIIFHHPSFTHHVCHTLSFTHHFVTHHLSHTTLSPTIFDTPSFPHHFVTHHLWHTIFPTPLCHPPSFTDHFVTHHLWDTMFSPLCHTPSFTHHFVTHHLSHTIFHTPSFCVAGVALGDIHLRFTWQAWHLETFTFVRGRRGTWRHVPSFCVAGVALRALGSIWWRACARYLVAGDAAALCVAGVALGDIHLRFTWQAWHLATSTFVFFAAAAALRALGSIWWRAWARFSRRWRRGTLRGRRGTWWHLPSFHVAGVALRALGSIWWRAWGAISRRSRRGTLCGRRGTWWHPPSFCVADVALGDIYLRLAWNARQLCHLTPTHSPSFTHHLSHTVFHTQLCHTPSFTPSFTHHVVTHHLWHTIFHTQLCPTPSLTHHFVTHHLSHTIFHTPLCHPPSLTHHVSHTTLPHSIFDTPLCHTPSFTQHLCHTLFHTPSLSHTIFHTPSFWHTIFRTPSFTHHFVTHHLWHTIFVTHHLSHTTWSHTIFHRPSFTHHFVSHYLSPHHPSHPTLSHTIFHHTIFHRQLCHTPSFTTPAFTHNFVTHHLSPHHLSHTIFHTQLCHTLSFTHNFHTHTHHLSHTTLSHTPSFFVTHHLFTYNLVTHNFVLLLDPPPPPLSFLPSPSPLQHLVLIIGRSCPVGLSGPLLLFKVSWVRCWKIRWTRRGGSAYHVSRSIIPGRGYQTGPKYLKRTAWWRLFKAFFLIPEVVMHQFLDPWRVDCFSPEIHFDFAGQLAFPGPVCHLNSSTGQNQRGEGLAKVPSDGWMTGFTERHGSESKALNSSGGFHKWECPNGWVVYDDCGYPYDLGHLQVGFLWNHCCNADASCFLYCPYQHYWVYNPCRAQVEIWTTRHGTNRIGRWMCSQFSGRGQASPWMCQIHTVWFWLINRLTSLNEQPEYEWRDSWPSRPLHFFTEGVCSAKVWQAVTDGSHPSVSGFLALGQCKYHVSNQFEVQERERNAEDDWSCSLPNHDSNHRADTGSVDRNPLAYKRLVGAFNGYFRTIEIYKDWFQTCVVVSSSALLGTRYSSDWRSWGGSQCCNLGPRVIRFCIHICVCVRVFFLICLSDTYMYIHIYVYVLY